MERYTSWAATGVVAFTLLAGTASAQTRADIAAGKHPHQHRPCAAQPRGGGAPANDECASAELLLVGVDCTAPTPGDNTGSTESMLGPACDVTNDSLYLDVWYTFNSGTNTSVDVDLVPSGDMTDWVLVVLDGCSGAELTCNIQPGAPITVEVTAATDYIVRVFSNTQFGTTGPFTICVIGTPPPPPPPANDDCAGAIVLTPGATCVPVDGTVASATETQPADSCSGFLGNANDDVWYTFVATTTDMYAVGQGSGSFDMVLEVFEGACGNLSPIGCSDTTVGGGAEAVQLNALTVGSTYTVRIFHYSGADPMDPTFTVCVVEGSIVGMGENTGVELFGVYPNPNDGRFNLVWMGEDGPVRYQVLDMTGRMVLSGQERMTRGALLPLADDAGWPQGAYTVRLAGADRIGTVRVVVQ